MMSSLAVTCAGQNRSVMQSSRARNILSGVITTNITTKHFPSPADKANYMIRNKKEAHARQERTVTHIFNSVLPPAQFVIEILFFLRSGIHKNSRSYP
jgi:hypothetical protein